MKWWDQMPWSSFSECWALTQLFHSPLSVPLKVLHFLLYRSSVYSCHLFLITSASVGSLPFLSFIEPIFACSLGICSFLDEISSLSHSVVFPLFLCIDCWGRVSYLSLLFCGTLHSRGYIFPFLLGFSLPFFSKLFVRTPQTPICFFAFLFLGDGLDSCLLYSVQFSHSVVSDSLLPHESLYARPTCPSPTPGVHSNSRPLSQWCSLAISSCVIPFSSCPQSLPALESFPVSQLFNMRWPKYWSFSFSIIPSKEIPGLMSFRIDWLDLLAVQGTLKSLLQHHSSKASILWCSAFFAVQLSHSHIHTWPQEKP